MSSNVLNAIKNLRKNLHNVGALNNWTKKSLNQGVVANENMDNFTLVKIEFDPTTGERIAKHIANDQEKGMLVASVEDYIQEYETISSFFNEKGEKVRVIAMEVGTRFECSNFDYESQNLVTNPIKNGQKVHYDKTSKKFKISNATANGMAGYNTAANKLVIVDKDCTSIDGQPIIRFEVVQ